MSNMRIVHAVTASESIKLMKKQHTYLKEFGFEITLISSPGNELNKAGLEEGVLTKAISMEREISLLKDIISLFRIISFFLKTKPNLTNVSTPKAGLLGGVAAWLTGVPCRVYTLRGLRLETASGIKRKILYLTEKMSCFCAHRVICISNSLRDRVIELGIVDSRKTIVLGSGSSNGLDIKDFLFDELMNDKIQNIRMTLEIPINVPIVGHVGRLTKDKGIVELVKAYLIMKVKYPDLRLLLVGRFEEGDPVPEKIRNIINKDDHIIKAGYVEDPIPYYYLMNILAFPTYREGFGNVALEAAATGKPVVTTNATGAVDTVIDGKTGFVVPIGNEQKLAEAIIQILDDAELAKKFGMNGRLRIENEYQSVKIWQELHQFYNEMLNEKKQGK